MKKTEGPSEAQLKEMIVQKLNDLHEDFGDDNQNFLSTFSITLNEPPQLDNIDNDVHREKAFIASTVNGVLKAKEYFDLNNIPYKQSFEPQKEEVKTTKTSEKSKKK